MSEQTLIEPTDRQLTRVPLRDPEVFNQIRHRVADLQQSYHVLFHGLDRGRNVRDVEAVAADICGELIHDETTSPNGQARAIVRHLVSPAEARHGEFWETALGRVVAMRGGYPNPTMSRSTAGALLDVSRQRVGQMVALGLLVEDRGGQVETASLVRLLVPA